MTFNSPAKRDYGKPAIKAAFDDDILTNYRFNLFIRIYWYVQKNNWISGIIAELTTWNIFSSVLCKYLLYKRSWDGEEDSYQNNYLPVDRYN